MGLEQAALVLLVTAFPAARLAMRSYDDEPIPLQVRNRSSFEDGSEVRVIDMAFVAAGTCSSAQDGLLRVKPFFDGKATARRP